MPPTSDNWPNNPSNPLPKPYTDLKLTASEAAALVGWGNLQVIPAFGDAMRAENPQLQMAPSLTWPADGSKPLASAATDATTLFATSFFKSQAPDTWKIPSSGPYDSPPGTPRGVDSSFALAKVSFNNVLNTFSGKPALQKFVYSATKLEPTQRYGVYWTLTDLATAKEMGLTPVAIRNAAGKYVLPTAASLAAAVPTMTKQADGTLLPNPASKANPDAYPLSFVEYALAPSAPLVSTAGAERLAAPGRPAAATTTPRTASQALLASWLTYATGAGQSNLPPGFAPLTADLQAQASKAIAAIGKGTKTPVKTPTKTPTKVPSAAGGPLGGGSIPLGLGLGLAGSGGLGSDVGAGLGSDAATAGTAAAAGLSDTGTRAPSSASTRRAQPPGRHRHGAPAAVPGREGHRHAGPAAVARAADPPHRRRHDRDRGPPAARRRQRGGTVVTLTTDPRRDVVPPGTSPRVDEPRAQEPVPDYAEALPRSARRRAAHAAPTRRGSRPPGSS